MLAENPAKLLFLFPALDIPLKRQGRSHFAAQAGLELEVSFLPLPPEY